MTDKLSTIEWGASWVSDEDDSPNVTFTFEPDGDDFFTSVSVFSPEHGDIPFMKKVELIKRWVKDHEEKDKTVGEMNRGL